MQKRPTSKPTTEHIGLFDSITYQNVGLLLKKKPFDVGLFCIKSPILRICVCRVSCDLEYKIKGCLVVSNTRILGSFDVGLFCIKSPILRIRVRSCDRQYIWWPTKEESSLVLSHTHTQESSLVCVCVCDRTRENLFYKIREHWALLSKSRVM